MGRTTERFCFSERTSPSSRSRARVPVHTAPAPPLPDSRACWRSCDGSAPRDLPLLERLDHVVDLDVVVADTDTALVALEHLTGIVLEATQRVDGEVVGDDDPISDEPRLAVPDDRAAAHEAAGDVPDPRDLEDIAHLGGTELPLFVDRLEQTLEGGFHFLDRLVDDRVVADVDTFGGSELGDLALRPDVEADDDRLRRRGQHDGGLGDRTDAPVDDAHADLVADVDLKQRVLECLDRTRTVTLEDQVELVDLALLHTGEQVLERDTATGQGQRRCPLAGLTPFGDLP